MELFAPNTLQHFIAAASYAVMGLVLFALSFLVIDWLTPGSMWKEIMEQKNTAVAILFGCWAIGLGIIIAAAIAG